jgi:hypothetical protein
VTFQVNIPALGGLPPFLDRRDAEMRAASGYLAGHAVVDDISVVYPQIAYRHRRNVAVVEQFLSWSGLMMSDEAGRIRSSTALYAAADSRAARRALAAADGALPDEPPDQEQPVASFDGSGDVTAAIFDDTLQPLTQLQPLPDASTYLPYKPSLSDVLSMTSTARDAVWMVTRAAAELGLLDHPVDPVELVLNPFLGDWHGILRSSDAFDCVAGMLAEESNVIATAHRLVPVVWSGHASDFCQADLHGFADAMHAGAVQLGILAGRYAHVGRYMHTIIQFASSMLATLVDCALDIGPALDTFGVSLLFDLPNLTSDFLSAYQSFQAMAAEAKVVVNIGFDADLLGNGLLPTTFAAIEAGDEQASIPLIDPGALGHPLTPEPAVTRGRRVFA